MTDLVARLQFAAEWSETEIDIAGPDLLKQAAVEIERLRKALEKIGKGGFPGASYIAREALSSTDNNTSEIAKDRQ